MVAGPKRLVLDYVRVHIVDGRIVGVRVDEQLSAHIGHAQDNPRHDGLVEPELPRKGRAIIHMAHDVADTELHLMLGLIIVRKIDTQPRHKTHHAEHDKKDGPVQAGNLRGNTQLCRAAIQFSHQVTEPGFTP